MYNHELVTVLEKVLNKSYQMKNGEHAFYCPFCNHHKKKLQINTETQKWHCWVCNTGGHMYGQSGARQCLKMIVVIMIIVILL